MSENQKMLKYLNNLIGNCEKAKKAVPSNELIILYPEQIQNIKKGIYVICEVGGDPEKTFQSFTEFKAQKSKACCKSNQPSEVLYVGFSTTGLRKRLRQHLVDCPDKTYSLHLYKWFEGQYEVRVYEYDEPNEIVQLIKDSISHRLRPAFGKRGGNNK